MKPPINNGFDQWGGYMNAKIAKLDEQYAAEANQGTRLSDIFAGVSIYINGLTVPPNQELRTLMQMHGGRVDAYLRNSTTYTIAENLPDVKMRAALKHCSEIFLKPKWVVDCIAAGRLLDYKPYMLVTNQNRSQPRLNFQKVEPAPAPSSDAVHHNKEERPEEFQLPDEPVAAPAEVVPPQEDRTEIDMEEDDEDAGPDASTAAAASFIDMGRLDANDPNFLQEYFGKSRLHHISTMSSRFKHLVTLKRRRKFSTSAGLRSLLSHFEGSGSLRSRPPEGKFIMHVDLDCFFVSVGLRKHPELRGQPVAVTHSKGGSAAREVPVHPDADRGAERALFMQRIGRVEKVNEAFDGKMSLSEIASCSYEARACGIKNGMFMGEALKLCPRLVAVPYDFEGYLEVATAMYHAMCEYTLEIEAVSCDEMFVDLSSILSHVPVDTMLLVKALRDRIVAVTGCPCSAGVGENKLQARMATKQAKPNGQFLFPSHIAADYMSPIPVRELPGCGHSMVDALRSAGVALCSDVANVPLHKLKQMLGDKMGERLQMHSRGDDDRPLVCDHLRKSVSVVVNYGIRFTELPRLQTFLGQMAEEAQRRLAEIENCCQSVSLKVMVRAANAPVETSKYLGHGVCDTLTKTKTLPRPSDDAAAIEKATWDMFTSMRLVVKDLRGLAIHLGKLSLKEDRKENPVMSMFAKMATKPKDVSVSATKAAVSSPPQPKKPLPKSSPQAKGGRRPSAANGRENGPKAVSVADMLKAAAKKPNTAGKGDGVAEKTPDSPRTPLASRDPKESGDAELSSAPQDAQIAEVSRALFGESSSSSSDDSSSSSGRSSPSSPQAPSSPSSPQAPSSPRSAASAEEAAPPVALDPANEAAIDRLFVMGAGVFAEMKAWDRENQLLGVENLLATLDQDIARSVDQPTTSWVAKQRDELNQKTRRMLEELRSRLLRSMGGVAGDAGPPGAEQAAADDEGKENRPLAVAQLESDDDDPDAFPDPGYGASPASSQQLSGYQQSIFVELKRWLSHNVAIEPLTPLAGIQVFRAIQTLLAEGHYERAHQLMRHLYRLLLSRTMGYDGAMKEPVQVALLLDMVQSQLFCPWHKLYHKLTDYVTAYFQRVHPTWKLYCLEDLLCPLCQ